MVVVFDGVCNLCNGWVGFLLKRDPGGVLRFAHCQSAYGAAVLRRLGEDPADPSTVLLVDGERVHIRSDAALRAIAALGGGWKAVMLLLAIPRPIRDAVYRLVAQRRYRWFGRTAQCAVPDPRFSQRFLA